jgi:hypothetical protein
VLEEADRSLHDALCVVRCLVHNRALLRNKRLMLAYMCVAPAEGRTALRALARYQASVFGSRADAARASRARSWSSCHCRQTPRKAPQALAARGTGPSLFPLKTANAGMPRTLACTVALESPVLAVNVGNPHARLVRQLR